MSFPIHFNTHEDHQAKRFCFIKDSLGIIGSPGSEGIATMLRQGNPVANFKLLYGTGHMKLDRESGQLTRVGGLSYTIRDGIVYDAKALLSDVRSMVTEAKAAAAAGTQTDS